MENAKDGLKKPRFTRKQKLFGMGIGFATLGATVFGVRLYNEKHTPPKSDYDPQNELGI